MAKGRAAIPIGDVGRAVAANVRRLRAAQGFTTRGLAAKVGMKGGSNITRVEQAERRVDVDDLVAFAREFGVTPADLLSAPFICPACQGVAPNGFACRTCGASG